MTTEATPNPQSQPSRGIGRYVTIIARLLLGLAFLVFGLNGFLHFIPMPKELPEPVTSFMGALMKTGYMFPLIFGTQTVAGALLLLDLFVPLALALLAPLIVNIMCFHLFVSRDGIGMAIIVTVLELYLAWAYRDAFRPMLRARVR